MIKSSGTDMVLGKFVDTTGSGTPNELVIEWNQVYRYGTPTPFTFEAVLQLNTGTNTSAITFDYASTVTGSAASNNGADATIGIKAANAQGANRLLVSYKSTSPYVGSQQAIQFTAPPFGSNLTGNVFNDFNRNGVHDAGEPGLANWKVYLDLNRNGTHDPGEPETVSDATGNNQLFVNTNGLITFGQSDIAWTNTDLSTSPREPAIAALWYDWLSSSTTPMILGKFVDTTGSGTPNELIIEWHAVQAHPTILNTI